jgi:hypothetical protein
VKHLRYTNHWVWWWYDHTHWLPWNWIPRRAYQICHECFGPGWVQFDDDFDCEFDNTDPEDHAAYTICVVWISPHRFKMGGEFEGW